MIYFIILYIISVILCYYSMKKAVIEQIVDTDKIIIIILLHFIPIVNSVLAIIALSVIISDKYDSDMITNKFFNLKDNYNEQ